MYPKELLNTFSCSMPLPNSSRAFLTLLLDNATSYSPSCNANLERHDQEFLLIPFTTAFALMMFVPPNLLQIKTPEFLPFYRPHFPRSSYELTCRHCGGAEWTPDHQPLLKKTTAVFKAKLLIPANSLHQYFLSFSRLSSVFEVKITVRGIMQRSHYSSFSFSYSQDIYSLNCIKEDGSIQSGTRSFMIPSETARTFLMPLEHFTRLYKTFRSAWNQPGLEVRGGSRISAAQSPGLHAAT